MNHKVAANTALVFAGVYAVLELLVYYAYTTAVRLDSSTNAALEIIGYGRFGLFFSYNQLGYAVMALATFFIGLTIIANSRSDKWIKELLMVHGVFLRACFIIPILGLFHTNRIDDVWIGK